MRAPQEGISALPINQALSFFSTALLVFAFIALFVGGFTIFNTFSIIVGQRTAELALLRIVGASRRQVFGSVLGEAAITGLVSSVIGLGLGVLAALGLEALLRGFGITLPTGSLVFEPRTALVGLAVGVGVTVVAAVGPARNAVRIPPVAALDDRQSGPRASLRRRFIWGAAVALAGGAAATRHAPDGTTTTPSSQPPRPPETAERKGGHHVTNRDCSTCPDPLPRHPSQAATSAGPGLGTMPIDLWP